MHICFTGSLLEPIPDEPFQGIVNVKMFVKGNLFLQILWNLFFYKFWPQWEGEEEIQTSDLQFVRQN